MVMHSLHRHAHTHTHTRTHTHTHTDTSVYVQAVLKIGAPGEVSSVGGTPGVWCLNVIGRECWVWVVPCTGSWPGQPPPTKWGKEP